MYAATQPQALPVLTEAQTAAVPVLPPQFAAYQHHDNASPQQSAAYQLPHHPTAVAAAAAGANVVNNVPTVQMVNGIALPAQNLLWDGVVTFRWSKGAVVRTVRGVELGIMTNDHFISTQESE